jgi:ABC-2 type transport system ATP-binding protein
MAGDSDIRLKAEGLSKQYGTQMAVKEVSFSLNKGEIAGFLGPNGAGKSTTMKMLSRYITPTAGTASICGISIFDEEHDLRKKLGYLPESNPLYTDLYVKEYLELMCGIHSIPSRERAKTISRSIERTGLGREQHKKIGQLSKGYQQRVGLAQALLHEPEVLILDEPTSGLDPNQLVEIRQLIREAGRDKTILFSSHILQEVEALADRIIVINQGEVVADGPAAEVRSSLSGRQEVSVEFGEIPEKNWFNSLGAGIRAEAKGTHRFVLSADSSAQDLRILISAFAREKGLSILELSRKELRLEEVFRKLTTSRKS